MVFLSLFCLRLGFPCCLEFKSSSVIVLIFILSLLQLLYTIYDMIIDNDKYSFSNTRQDEMKKVQKMVEVLKGLLENIK